MTTIRAKIYPELATLVLRLFVGSVLVYGTQDNIFSQQRMLEFRDFLQQSGFPYPLLCAYVSAWVQFVSGLLLLLGLTTRLVAGVVVVNFLVALFMVHWGAPFNQNIAPLSMLVGGLYFGLRGAGKYSLDAHWHSYIRSGLTAQA